jgi:hypothetical protein
MTKTYDIDPITDLTGMERSEVLLGLDARAQSVLRSITLFEGQYGADSEHAYCAWETLGDIVNAYSKVAADRDFHEAWLTSFSANNEARLREAAKRARN